MFMYLFLLLWHTFFVPFCFILGSCCNLLEVAHSCLFVFYLSRTILRVRQGFQYFLWQKNSIFYMAFVIINPQKSGFNSKRSAMQLQGCLNTVLQWPSGIVTVGMGIWRSGVEEFTSCIVYWYIVQFFNTFYLQQYLCIFYEVIKINNVAHKRFYSHFILLQKFCFVFFLKLSLQSMDEARREWRHRWGPHCACAPQCWLAAAAAGGAESTTARDGGEITAPCSSALEMARYSCIFFFTPPPLHRHQYSNSSLGFLKSVYVTHCSFWLDETKNCDELAPG